jgi:hypothetical protein
MSDLALRSAFIDICRGYTKAKWNKSDVFIKHFSHFEQLDVENERENYFLKAKERGVQSYSEKVDWLIKEGLWSKDQDRKIRDLNNFIDGLKKTKLKALTKGMADEYQKQIDDEQFIVDKLNFEKEQLVGLTSEKYAEQKMQTSYVYFGFYKDDQFKERLFTEKQFKRLDDEEIDYLIDIYIHFIQKFTHDKIKKISISSFFTSYFYLSENLIDFFKKPLYELTFNQINLISYGSYFRNLLSSFGEGMPAEIKKDPEKIEEFVNRKNSLGSTKAKESGNGRTMIIGATEKDDGAFIGGIKDDIMSKGEIETAFDGIRSGKVKIN